MPKRSTKDLNKLSLSYAKAGKEGTQLKADLQKNYTTQTPIKKGSPKGVKPAPRSGLETAPKKQTLKGGSGTDRVARKPVTTDGTSVSAPKKAAAVGAIARQGKAFRNRNMKGGSGSDRTGGSGSDTVKKADTGGGPLPPPIPGIKKQTARMNNPGKGQGGPAVNKPSTIRAKNKGPVFNPPSEWGRKTATKEKIEPKGPKPRVKVKAGSSKNKPKVRVKAGSSRGGGSGAFIMSDPLRNQFQGLKSGRQRKLY